MGFRSLHENIDTTTPGGKLVFHVFGALAEFERDMYDSRQHTVEAIAKTIRCQPSLGYRHLGAVGDQEGRLRLTLGQTQAP